MPLLKVHGKTPARLEDPAAVKELPPPGKKPNCASSHPDARGSGRVEPLRYTGSAEDAIAAVRSVVSQMPGAEVVFVSEGRYLYARFMSKLFQFVDDFEVLVRSSEGPAGGASDRSTVLDVRSASRVGYGDKGVNRKRVESIRSALVKN